MNNTIPIILGIIACAVIGVLYGLMFHFANKYADKVAKLNGFDED